MEDIISGLCMGPEGQMPSQPGLEAADSHGPWMACEGEAAPAAATGERTGTGVRWDSLGITDEMLG